MTTLTPQDIRNIAIIAHVDHGKTTLIDSMLKQSGLFRDNEHVAERVMDSNDLEKERGITILAKCTAINFSGKKINIIDTPGHADFGGEVERVLGMVDGVLLLVDSSEGPMPQTKFVLSKALKLGLKPIVVINKVDRQDARIQEVENEVFDLFVALDATDEQLDFPIVYAVGRDGWAALSMQDERKDLKPLLDLVVTRVESPKVDINAPFAMLTTILQADSFLGRVLTGKVHGGRAKVNSQVKSINLDGKLVDTGRLTKLQTYQGISRIIVDEVIAGDIIAVAGMANTSVSDTICDPQVQQPLKSTPVDPPTLSMTISPNTSPLAGKEGAKVTSNLIRERLMKEAEINVAIRVKESDNKDSFEVGGRGELQLGVLIETMRREGFELSVARPKVVFKRGENGELLEPIEEIVVDVNDEYLNNVISTLSNRKGDTVEIRPSGLGRSRAVFLMPSRGMIGYHSNFFTDTRGTGILNRLFHSYQPYKGDITSRSNGALISIGQGDAVAYAIFNLQDRGTMFISHNDKVYDGMIVGEHNRDNDLCINVLKGKQLTNVRASGSDENIKLVPPKKMTLEEMISYIKDDELVEVTPKSLRLRKKVLDANERKRYERSGADATV